MSKLFFDRLTELKEVDKQIKKIAKTSAEREELWLLVDEIVHHKVMGCILDKLPKDNHDEFLTLYHKSPHDEELLFGYLRGKVGEGVEEMIKKEIEMFSDEFLNDLKNGK